MVAPSSPATSQKLEKCYHMEMKEMYSEILSTLEWVLLDWSSARCLGGGRPLANGAEYWAGAIFEEYIRPRNTYFNSSTLVSTVEVPVLAMETAARVLTGGSVSKEEIRQLPKCVVDTVRGLNSEVWVPTTTAVSSFIDYKAETCTGNSIGFDEKQVVIEHLGEMYGFGLKVRLKFSVGWSVAVNPPPPPPPQHPSQPPPGLSRPFHVPFLPATHSCLPWSTARSVRQGVPFPCHWSRPCPSLSWPVHMPPPLGAVGGR